jgi:hypothetical protein
MAAMGADARLPRRRLIRLQRFRGKLGVAVGADALDVETVQLDRSAAQSIF